MVPVWVISSRQLPSPLSTSRERKERGSDFRRGSKQTSRSGKTFTDFRRTCGGWVWSRCVRRQSVRTLGSVGEGERDDLPLLPLWYATTSVFMCSVDLVDTVWLYEQSTGSPMSKESQQTTHNSTSKTILCRFQRSTQHKLYMSTSKCLQKKTN